jgi:hypothetical protein
LPLADAQYFASLSNYSPSRTLFKSFATTTDHIMCNYKLKYFI